MTDKYIHDMTWFDRIGIDRTCKLVAACRGCINLTKTDDGTHTLWLYDHRLATGSAVDMRNRYADFLRSDWLEKYYRSR